VKRECADEAGVEAVRIRQQPADALEMSREKRR
jgi:hypothetical protein